MIEYSSGLRTLDMVYLDTSFTEDVVFQTKAEGLRELLDKISKYPKEAHFHFSAWTYGYEQVWITLAKALDTQVCRYFLSNEHLFFSDCDLNGRFMSMTTN